MFSEELVKSAETFARKAHEGHTRTNKAKSPYSTHLEEVANLVASHGGTNAEIAAAWLHDSVEDGMAFLSDIALQFGGEVAAIVEELTDLPEWKKLPPLVRKSLQAERIQSSFRQAKIVKLADQTSNVRLCINDPPTTWSKERIHDYIEGSRRVAFACRNVNEDLDILFESVFRKAYTSRLR